MRKNPSRAALHAAYARQLAFSFHQLGDGWQLVPDHPTLRTPSGVILAAHRDGRVAPVFGTMPAATLQHRDGYRQIKSGETEHRIVCVTFHGPPPFKGAQVRHLDGNPANNCADNLAWGTAADNAADKKAHGRQMNGHQADQARILRDLQWSMLKGPTLFFSWGLPGKTARSKRINALRELRGLPRRGRGFPGKPPPLPCQHTRPLFEAEPWPPADPGAPDWPPGQNP